MTRSIPFALCTALAAYLIIRYWGLWAEDAAALYFAGHFYDSGALGMIYTNPNEPFRPGMIEAWGTAAANQVALDEVVFAYLYPPLWAALLAPASHLSPMAFFNATLVVIAVAAVASVLLSWQIAGRPHALLRHVFIAAVALVATQPGMLAFALKQPQILMLALTLFSMERLSRQQSLAAGGILGLAAAIKLSPALFAVIFVMERDWRALGGFVAVAATLAVASFAVAGPELHVAFLERLSTVDEQVIKTTINYNLAPLLHQVFTDPLLREGTILDHVSHVPSPVWIKAVSVMIFLGVLVFLVQRGVPRPAAGRRALSVIAIAIAGNLCGPLGWAHYYILPMLLLPAFYAVMPLREANGWIIAMLTLHMVPYMEPVRVFAGDVPVAFALPTLFWIAVLGRALAALAQPAKAPEDAAPQPAE